jgi:hypothetical protein
MSLGDDKEEVSEDLTVVGILEKKVSIPTIFNAVCGQCALPGYHCCSYHPYIPPTHCFGNLIGLTSTKDLHAWYLWVHQTGTPNIH